MEENKLSKQIKNWNSRDTEFFTEKEEIQNIKDMEDQQNDTE